MEEEKKVGEKRKRAEEVADMMVVSKEGFDDERKLLRTVFVGNLPLKFKKKLILKEFRKFGEVESVRIRSVPIVDRSVNAYVVFETEQAAEASLAHNMSLIDGNHIRVDRACPPRKKLKGQDDHLSVVLISGLSCSIVINIISYSQFVLFTGKSNLENNVEAVRVIRDLQYRISRVKADATPSKRKTNPSDAYSPAQKRDKVVIPVATEKANLSYQGVRASNSGDDKKKPYQKSPAQSKMRPRSSSSSSNEGNKAGSSSNNSAVKQRSQKRPSCCCKEIDSKHERLKREWDLQGVSVNKKAEHLIASPIRRNQNGV
ncbi:hypothetical protein IGI04_007698, partial [Brassica rapa subsp. trilocularis]